MWQARVFASAWSSFVELRKDFLSADYVAPYTVFNIRGNRYRIIARIFYAERVIVVDEVLTHAEYDKRTWR